MTATRLREVDAVVIGMGWAGSIVARELTRAGMEVVGLERGGDQTPGDNFTVPAIRDELRYAQRQELIQDPAVETVTFRNTDSEVALPVRRFGAFLPGSGVGGGGTHWAGQHWRFLPSDLRIRSHLTERYGARAVPSELTLRDWGVSYEELESDYDRFEKLCGVSGKAGNLRGALIAGGNVFEGARSAQYPNAPLRQCRAGERFEAAASELGCHPFPVPASNASAAYTNPEGLTLGPCQYCGFCGRYGCESNAKASPNTTLMPVLRASKNFSLRTHAFATRLLYRQADRRVTGVVYTDLRTGKEFEQPAQIVVLAAFVFSNTRLLLLSGIGRPYDARSGKGVVGRSYCYQNETHLPMLFEDEHFNPFMSAGAMGTAIDDFNGDNFDHAGLGFFGGGFICCTNSSSTPIGARTLPPGTPRWGHEWKKSAAHWYTRSATLIVEGSGYPARRNYLDLDPTYRDRLGLPLLRMTYDITGNDRKMSRYLSDTAVRIARQMRLTHLLTPDYRDGKFGVVAYQSSHNAGGTVMGSDPDESAVNRHLQSWNAHNLFIVGASVFPHQPGYNPTGTVGALAFRAARSITRDYVRRPDFLA